jgi:hypothetical protein
VTLLPALETSTLRARASYRLDVRCGSDNNKTALGRRAPLDSGAMLDEVLSHKTFIARHIIMVNATLIDAVGHDMCALILQASGSNASRSIVNTVVKILCETVAAGGVRTR